MHTFTDLVWASVWISNFTIIHLKGATLPDSNLKRQNSVTFSIPAPLLACTQQKNFYEGQESAERVSESSLSECLDWMTCTACISTPL